MQKCVLLEGLFIMVYLFGDLLLRFMYDLMHLLVLAVSIRASFHHFDK
jgi:hypothetical protein